MSSSNVAVGQTNGRNFGVKCDLTEFKMAGPAWRRFVLSECILVIVAIIINGKYNVDVAVIRALSPVSYWP